MLSRQIDRILLIEKFMNTAWNIGKSGFKISGTAKSFRIISNILNAIINNVELTVGLNSNDHIPPREAANFPYQLIEELRQAGITTEDLSKIDERRAANKQTVVYLAETLLTKSFRDFDNMELHIWKVSQGAASNYLSAQDIQKVKDANFIKLDLSGFFTASRVLFFKTFFDETLLNAQQILTLSLPLSEKAQFLACERLLYQKELVEKDFLRLIDHGISITETVNDIINIGHGRESRFAHIRPSYYISRDRFYVEYVEYIAKHMTINLGHKYKNYRKPTPAPVTPSKVILHKTEEELAAEKKARENGYQSLLSHFHLTPEDARSVADTTDVGNLYSLWHIKTNVMPDVEKVLAELMEQFSGNIQMVEDLVVFEQTIWSNETRAWEKYHIPAQQMNSHSKSMTSYVSKEHSDILLHLNLNLTLPLIKPLRQNLTLNYQANHPNETVVIGRDLELFKKYALIHDWKMVPEFMFDNSNVIAIINSTKPLAAPVSEPHSIFDDYQDATITPELNLLTREQPRGSLGSHIILAADIIILGTLVALLLHSFRKPLNFWRKTLFGCKQDAQYAPVATHDDEHVVAIKMNRFG